MNRWAKHLLLSAVLSLAVLSSAWAWPSARTSAPVAEAAYQEPQEGLQAEAAQEESLPSTEEASTGPQTPSGNPSETAPAAIAGDPAKIRDSLRGSLGDRAYERIEAYLDILIAEYEDACDRYDELAAEYDALAADHAALINDSFDRDVDFLIAPEAVYDITDNQWGVGLTLAASWKNLMVTAGAEKMLGDRLGWDEGYRVRLGVGYLF